MLYEPTIQKMQAMKLSGMVEALEEQRKTADMGAWSFEVRLACWSNGSGFGRKIGRSPPA